MVESCSRGQLVGRVHLVLDSKTGRPVPGQSRVLPPMRVCHDVFQGSGDCQEPRSSDDPVALSPLLKKHRDWTDRVTTALAPYRKGIEDVSRRVLARATRPVLHRRAALSQVGTMFARALLQSTPGADAALINGGAVRNDLPSGEVRYADLFEAFPFENRLATVRLTGAELTAVVAKLLRRHGLPLLAGLQLRLRCGPPRALAAILDARGRPLQRNRLYTLALSDFLLTGGDGLGPLLGPVPARRKRLQPQSAHS